MPIEPKVVQEALQSLRGKMPKNTVALTDEYFSAIVAALAERGIVPTLPAGKEKLRSVITTAAQERKTSAEFAAGPLEDWIEYYEELSWQDTQKLQARVARVLPGIYGSLYRGESPDFVWGDDNDARIILGNKLLTMPDHVRATKPGQAFILPPVSIVPGPNEQAHESPVAAGELYFNQIKTVLENKENKDKEFNLLIPVVASESHWFFSLLKVQSGKITEATIIDSMSQANEQARVNVQKVVGEINGNDNVKVKAEAWKIQTGGNACLDFTVQGMLSFYKQLNNVTLDPEHEAICQAKTDAKVREATVNATLLHAPQMPDTRQYAENQVGTLLSAIKPDMSSAEEKAFEDNLSNFLQDKNSPVGLQVQFDALMAKNLNELYASHDPVKEDEKKVIEIARTKSFIEILSRFGMFVKPEQIKEKQEVLQQIISRKSIK